LTNQHHSRADPSGKLCKEGHVRCRLTVSIPHAGPGVFRYRGTADVFRDSGRRASPRWLADLAL